MITRISAVVVSAGLVSGCVLGVPVPVPPPAALQGELAVRPLDRQVPWRCSVADSATGTCLYVQTCDTCQYLAVGTPVRIRSEDVGAAATYSNAEYQTCDGRSIAWRQEATSLKDYLAPRVPDSTWSIYCNRTRTWQAHVVDFGLYQPELEKNPTGGPLVVRSKKLLRSSRTVQATKGTSIGFRYLLDGPQDSATLTVRATHPPLTNPATGKTTQIDEWSQAVSTRRLYWNTGWTFEHDWELVAGRWTIELLLDGKRLQSVSLDVATSQ